MDVIIIGAGAAGLMAARILSAKGKKVMVLEGRERLGGRIHTNENTFSFNAEAGAEFIHGNLKLTNRLLNEAGLKQTKGKGGIYRIKDGNLDEENDFIEDWGILMKRLNEIKTDITIKAFLDNYMPEEKYADIKESFSKYVQGYDAADIKDASAFSIREEMQNEEDVQFRVENGYSGLINFLAAEIKKNGSVIKTSEIVKQIKWQKNKVEVVTNNKTHKAQKVVVTVPLGVLQAKENEEGAIKFFPEITEQQKAINDMGYGGVIKILFQFDEAFWFNKQFLLERNIDEPFFIFGDTFIPTWWTQYPTKKPLLVGWLAGPDSYKHSHLNENEFLEKGIASLATVFKMEAGDLHKKLTAYKIYNWVTDPLCKGAYSYRTIASKKAIKLLRETIQNTVYFAGEAFAEEGTATVDAALQSGQEVAKIILKIKDK